MASNTPVEACEVGLSLKDGLWSGNMDFAPVETAKERANSDFEYPSSSPHSKTPTSEASQSPSFLSAFAPPSEITPSAQSDLIKDLVAHIASLICTVDKKMRADRTDGDRFFELIEQEIDAHLSHYKLIQLSKAYTFIFIKSSHFLHTLLNITENPALLYRTSAAEIVKRFRSASLSSTPRDVLFTLQGYTTLILSVLGILYSTLQLRLRVSDANQIPHPLSFIDIIEGAPQTSPHSTVGKNPTHTKLLAGIVDQAIRYHQLRQFRKFDEKEESVRETFLREKTSTSIQNDPQKRTHQHSRNMGRPRSKSEPNSHSKRVYRADTDVVEQAPVTIASVITEEPPLNAPPISSTSTTKHKSHRPTISYRKEKTKRSLATKEWRYFPHRKLLGKLIIAASIITGVISGILVATGVLSGVGILGAELSYKMAMAGYAWAYIPTVIAAGAAVGACGSSALGGIAYGLRATWHGLCRLFHQISESSRTLTPHEATQQAFALVQTQMARLEERGENPKRIRLRKLILLEYVDDNFMNPIWDARLPMNAVGDHVYFESSDGHSLLRQLKKLHQRAYRSHSKTVSIEPTTSIEPHVVGRVAPTPVHTPPPIIVTPQQTPEKSDSTAARIAEKLSPNQTPIAYGRRRAIESCVPMPPHGKPERQASTTIEPVKTLLEEQQKLGSETAKKLLVKKGLFGQQPSKPPITALKRTSPQPFISLAYQPA